MNLGLRLQSWFIRALVFALTCTGADLAHAQVAAKVTHITGTVVETDAAGRSRTLAADSSVAVGARLSTASDSYAHLKFGDGTDLYLRSNTEYVIEKYQFTEQKPAEDGFVTRLLKGGFRQVTGLLGRRSPAAVRIAAKTSTIGIRGTDFGVRICETTCVGDTDTGSRITPAEAPIARVVSLQGKALAGTALTTGGRLLAEGAAIYAGNVVTTGDSSEISLVFRDGTRISLAANTELAIEEFHFDAAEPAMGSATLVQRVGGARVQTGTIGKTRPDRFVYRTPNGLITPQGSSWNVIVKNARGASLQAGQAEANQRRAAEDQRRQQDEQRKAADDQRKADEDRKRAADDQRKQAEDQRKQAEDQRKQQEDAKTTAMEEGQRRQEEAQRKADEDRKRAADDQRKQAEEQRKQAEDQRKQQEDAKTTAMEEGQRRQEEAQRKADEDRKRAADDQRKQAEEQRKQADELKKQLETQVTVQEGAVIVTSQQDSQRIDPSSAGLQVIADGRPEPLPGRVEVHAPDPSTVSADPIRMFGEAGGTKADAGVYVTVFDGAVSLRQADVEIVLVKGETGFADAKNSPPQLLDSPPPILRHDLLLGNAALGSQSCPP